MTNKRGGRRPDPDVLIVCDCGARWSGRFAVNNAVIDAHRQRERAGKRIQGVRCRVHPPTKRNGDPIESEQNAP